MFDLADLALASARTGKVAGLSRSHAAGLASTSLVFGDKTCPTRKTPQQRPVVAPILAELALAETLRDAYHTVIDAVDEGKELTFALIQDHCAREIRRTTRDPDRHGPARGDARRFVRPQTGTPTRAAVPRRQDFSSDRPGDISAFLCNILEANNVKPKRFSGPATFLLTTCRMAMLLMLCSRLLYLNNQPFIVLTETKFSYRYIPVWARYSPHRTRVEAHANMLSP
jgi:hypothetical protein